MGRMLIQARDVVMRLGSGASAVASAPLPVDKPIPIDRAHTDLLSVQIGARSQLNVFAGLRDFPRVSLRQPDCGGHDFAGAV